MQFLTADPEPPRQHIGGIIRSFIIAVTPIMADAIDAASGVQRNPDHLDRPNRQPERAEQQNLDDHQQSNAGNRKRTVIQIALQPVLRHAWLYLLSVSALRDSVRYSSA